MKRYLKEGFTLIELLVVIAIISLLSSIVLSSLNSARDKATNAVVKIELSMMRTSAYLISDTLGTFDTVCDAGSNSGLQFRHAFNNSTKEEFGSVCLSSGITAFMGNGSILVSVGKAATPGQWAASMRLKNGMFFCVDYTGIAQEQGSRGIDNSPLDVNCN